MGRMVSAIHRDYVQLLSHTYPGPAKLKNEKKNRVGNFLGSGRGNLVLLSHFVALSGELLYCYFSRDMWLIDFQRRSEERQSHQSKIEHNIIRILWRAVSPQ